MVRLWELLTLRFALPLLKDYELSAQILNTHNKKLLKKKKEGKSVCEAPLCYGCKVTEQTERAKNISELRSIPDAI